MAGYLSTNMKRKDLADVNDDFSDFSLSSPARKIRRLDVELPPIMEEEEPKVPLVFEEQMEPAGSGPVREKLPIMSENEERAIVPFKPMSTPLFQTPSSFSVIFNSDIMSGIKNQILWSSQSNTTKSAEDEAEKEISNATGTNGCLAVIPWVPTNIPPTLVTEAPQAGVLELMDSEDTEAADMEIEDTNFTTEPSGGINEGPHHWQQQHCSMPQVPHNTPTPITWFR